MNDTQNTDNHASERHTHASLLWLDIETSGLDRTDDFIMEIFARATNDMLEQVGVRDFHALIRTVGPGSMVESFKRMIDTPKVLDMHARNGLLSELAASDGQAPVMTLSSAQKKFRSFVEEAHSKSKVVDDERKRLSLAGSSVDFDRGFLVEKGFISSNDKAISHRVLDVSSLMVGMTTLGWEFDRVSDTAHRAKDDALASLDTFKRLRGKLQRPGSSDRIITL